MDGRPRCWLPDVWLCDVALPRLLLGVHAPLVARDDWPGWDEVVALVPEAEMHDLIIELRSQTMGLGTFRKRFDHLAETRAVP